MSSSAQRAASEALLFMLPWSRSDEADLSGLPPTAIINAEIDPLRSDGEMLAEAMEAAGVEVEQQTFDGVTHEFFGMAPVVPQAEEAQNLAGDALQQAWDQVSQ